MERPNDYEGQESSETFDIKFERPVFIRQGKNVELKREKRVQKPLKSACKPSHGTRVKNPSSKPLIFVQEDLDNSQSTCSDEESLKPPKKATNRETYYEYGESVGGYRFVGTEREMLDFESSKGANRIQKSDSFDAQSFDRPNLSEKQRFSTHDYIVRYWNQDKGGSALYFPILSANRGEHIHINDLTADRVEQFYLHSCSQLGFDLPSILKRERLKWHPDRLLGKLAPEDAGTVRKITRLFQIINELWESQ
ncbi:hypothetical protein HG536_0F01280 [Torulaspora globosa]|uniref:Uncharacterized protein n=1 Tax=Torulaspora globosa TaxID=48254 RepID=A0A7G3ZJW7_9SACH|nr:uncharacterized protein HG536_0F01280 [Torulaspora globosa]QLL33803.1 hypothetical protein HG536_0F01280 [Torulaspora globosa]